MDLREFEINNTAVEEWLAWGGITRPTVLRQKGGSCFSVIEYENELYICSDSVKKALEIQSVLSFSAQVMEVNTDDNCRFLSDPEQNYLIGWDAEKYRKNIK